MLDEATEQEREIDILELLFVVKKNIAIILAAGILTGLLGFCITKYFIVPVYEASSTMIVNTRTDQSATVTNDQITSAENLVDTYAIIIQSSRVLDQVIKNLDLKENYRQLQQKVSVEPINSTQVMRIAVRDPDPEKALKIIAEIVQVAPDTIIDTVEAGSVKKIELPTVSSTPVAPNVKMNTLLAFLTGAALTVSYFIVRVVMDNTFKSAEDIQGQLAIPVLGIIPNLENPQKHKESRQIKCTY